MTQRLFRWAIPGVVFSAAFAASAVLGTAKDQGQIIKPEPCTLEKADPAPLAGDAPTPEEVNSRLHGCQKLAYTSLRAFLVSRGVNIDAVGSPDTAGELYKGAKDTLGVPKLDSRLGERSFHTTSAATKLFDIFLQAAPEIIQNISDPAKAPACVLNSTSKPMFEADGKSCVEQSVSCILGRPATKDDVSLCNLLLTKTDPTINNDLAIKQRIAVATLLSAGHTCE
jgi:hypothetical protein